MKSAQPNRAYAQTFMILAAKKGTRVLPEAHDLDFREASRWYFSAFMPK